MKRPTTTILLLLSLASLTLAQASLETTLETDTLETSSRAPGNGFAHCFYKPKRMTAPLVIGGKQKRVGTMRAILRPGHIAVKYTITRKGCTLTNTANVHITPRKMHNPAPGRFSCHRNMGGARKSVGFKCRANLFQDWSCCAKIRIYTQAEIRCGENVFVVYAGPKNNQCSRKNGARWCRYMHIHPQCRECDCGFGTPAPPTLPKPVTPKPHAPKPAPPAGPTAKCVHKTKKCNTACDKSYRCHEDECVQPKACPYCKSYRPYVCPGESCAAPKKCITCPYDKKEACPNESCVTPVKCPSCSSVFASSCPSDGLCKGAKACPNCPQSLVCENETCPEPEACPMCPNVKKCKGEECPVPISCPLCPGVKKCPGEEGDCPVPVACPGCIDTKKCPNETCPKPAPCADAECGMFCEGETCKSLITCATEGCGMVCGTQDDCPKPVTCPGGDGCGTTCGSDDVCPSPETCM